MRGGSEIENWVFVLGGRVGAVGCLLWWTSCTTWQAGTAAAGCGTVDQEEEEEEEVEEEKEEEGEKEEVKEEEQACTPPLRPQRQLSSCCGITRGDSAISILF